MGVSSAIYWRATGSASDVAENNPEKYDVTMSSVQRYTTNECLRSRIRLVLVLVKAATHTSELVGN